MAGLATHIYEWFQATVDFLFGGHRRRLDREVAPLGDLSGKRVLEFGAGTCRVAAHIKRTFPSAEVVASDVSEEFLERGRRKADLITVVSETEELAGRLRGRFDVVLGVDTLHHHRNRVRALENCRQLLRRGGKLMIRETGRFSAGFRLYRWLDGGDRMLWRLQGKEPVEPGYFSQEELVDLLGKLGFREIRADGDVVTARG